MMAPVFSGRFTAAPDKEFVVFLIGMRVNKWWLFHKWMPLVGQMIKMIICLERDRKLGLLSYENFYRFFPITTCLITYWDSFEALNDFSKNKDQPHADAWRKFFANVGESGDLGIWHETYKCNKGSYECVYNNMSLFGLAKATKQVPISKETSSATQRLGQLNR